MHGILLPPSKGDQPFHHLFRLGIAHFGSVVRGSFDLIEVDGAFEFENDFLRALLSQTRSLGKRRGVAIGDCTRQTIGRQCGEQGQRDLGADAADLLQLQKHAFRGRRGETEQGDGVLRDAQRRVHLHRLAGMHGRQISGGHPELVADSADLHDRRGRVDDVDPAMKHTYHAGTSFAQP